MKRKAHIGLGSSSAPDFYKLVAIDLAMRHAVNPSARLDGRFYIFR
jgi:hypothetical protein